MRSAGLLCILGMAFGQQALWEKHRDEAKRLEEAGRFQEAKAVYQLALRDGERPSELIWQATLWNDVAVLSRYLGNRDEARQQYQRALELLETAGRQDRPAYAAILHNLGCTELAGRTTR